VSVERFIKEINPDSKLPFLDVDYLRTNIRPGTHVQLTFMPSGRFLELSRPLEGDEYLAAVDDPDNFEMNDNDDLWDQARSTGYSADRQLSGRGLPVALGYNPLRNSITYHDGRHRNIANYNINGKDAVMPVLIFSDFPTRQLPNKATIPEQQDYASPKNIPKINEFFTADLGSLSGEARNRDVERIREVGNYGEYGYPQGMSNRRKEIAQFKTDAEYPSYADPPFMFDEDEQKLMPTTTQRKIKAGMSETFKAMNKAWMEFKKWDVSRMTDAYAQSRLLAQYDPVRRVVELGRNVNEDNIDDVLAHEGMHGDSFEHIPEEDMNNTKVGFYTPEEISRRAQWVDSVSRGKDRKTALVEELAMRMEKDPTKSPYYARSKLKRKNDEAAMKKAWEDYKMFNSSSAQSNERTPSGQEPTP
jgi:hypothetical protein